MATTTTSSPLALTDAMSMDYYSHRFGLNTGRSPLVHFLPPFYFLSRFSSSDVQLQVGRRNKQQPNTLRYVLTIRAPSSTTTTIPPATSKESRYIPTPTPKPKLLRELAAPLVPFKRTPAAAAAPKVILFKSSPPVTRSTSVSPVAPATPATAATAATPAPVKAQPSVMILNITLPGLNITLPLSPSSSSSPTANFTASDKALVPAYAAHGWHAYTPGSFDVATLLAALHRVLDPRPAAAAAAATAEKRPVTAPATSPYSSMLSSSLALEKKKKKSRTVSAPAPVPVPAPVPALPVAVISSKAERLLGDYPYAHIAVEDSGETKKKRRGWRERLGLVKHNHSHSHSHGSSGSSGSESEGEEKTGGGVVLGWRERRRLRKERRV